MSTVFQPTRLVGAIAIAMGFSSPAFAQDQSTEKTATLDTIVVTASRSEQKISEVPARINIIEPKILEQSPIASLPQLLETDASINMVQSGGYGQSASIFLRGTNSNHTLLLRDGVRLNSNTSGAASLPFIDTTDIKQIEVLKGPASVLYGADAIGGVVQLISKTPEKTSAFITGEIGENKTYKSVVGADLAENGFYAQIRGQRLETDGTPVTDAKDSKKASFDQKGYSAKIGVEKELFAASVDYSENEGYSDYDN
ncbi:MAG TPA: TonB-dependent receptor, partial [Acinetobacter sp.]|uniref:TonB-dependent receptor n=1 Tax=Acinetobacter venetianus TaxID=52133 RepID=UPI000E85ACD7